MNAIKRQAYPAIYSLISDTELTLSHLTGFHVKLRMDLSGNALTQKDANRLLLQQLICEEFSVSWSNMRIKKRVALYVDARSAYCYLAITFLGQTLEETGKDIDRHYTSIISLRDRCKDLMDVDDRIKIKVEKIKTKLHENFN